ncbi:MAG: type II CRISPR RNA-guided endonuclease Cas9, partial [Clostridia bacterium]|nr:type II CRISPR RNA-guided endonuclease Cas9 [Clostridia bacterium]
KTKNKTTKTESKTFQTIYSEHEKKMVNSKKQKAAMLKWDNATDEERKKLSKPWNRMNDVERKIEVINKYYSGKIKKLITKGSELPEGFINRDLANTQYITKKAKEMLGSIARYVVCSTGAITDRLREDWQLVDVMRELNWEKYDQLGLTEIINKTDYEGKPYKVYKIKGWTKRNDHRHHAMDALTTAFTKRSIIQYLNNLNSRRVDEEQSISNAEKDDYELFSITSEDVILPTKDVLAIEKNELYRDEKNKLRFNPPMPLDEFRAEAKRQLENTLISIKAKNKVVTRNINTSKKKSGTNKKVQLTPRGQLHLETVYGSSQRYVTKEEKVNASFDAQKIATVASPRYRQVLLARLQQFGNDPKKAFTGKNSLEKNPVWIDELHTEKVPEKVKIVGFETIYTIRKEITPDLKIEKVVDKHIREILQKRLDDFGGDAKKAFANLDENPIYLNEEKGITIKRVTITGISNAEALHYKRDKDGKPILDENDNKQPVDFVNTGNNHHV